MRCLDFRRLVGLQQHGTGINGVKALFSNRSDDCAKKLPSSKREQCALTQTRRQVRTKSKMEKRNCLRKNQCLIGYCLTGWSKNAYHSCALKDACHCHTRGQYASHDQTRKTTNMHSVVTSQIQLQFKFVVKIRQRWMSTTLKNFGQTEQTMSENQHINRMLKPMSKTQKQTS